MNIGRVYTPPMFIARNIDPSTWGMGERNEEWKSVHPSNIHREAYRPLDMG